MLSRRESQYVSMGLANNSEWSRSSKYIRYVTIISLLVIPAFIINFNFVADVRSTIIRLLSNDLGDGNCEWTLAEPLNPNTNPYGTLFASYPGAGMRLIWQMTEGASGVAVGDDFFYSGKIINGLVKTQYPHPEGVWSWGEAMNQTILVVRNPRWNIPAYHHLLFELEYAHDYKVAYENIYNTYTRRAPMENWIKWRDYRFEDEINLWGWQIDFWMEGGTQFWDNLDFERAGQYPFSYHDEGEKPWPKDAHCRNDVDCVPKALVSYERLLESETGADELRKITDLLRYKKKMETLVSDEAMDCIWLETFVNAPERRNADRDAFGMHREDYQFTIKQMETILAKLTIYKHKYSTGVWEMNPIARDLVTNFHEYIRSVTLELAEMHRQPPPTAAPVTDMLAHQQEQVEWYNTLGRGNRYAKDLVQQMAEYWPLVKDLYNETDAANSTLATQCAETDQELTEKEQEWLDGHNIRRTEFYDRLGLPPMDLEWSADLAASATAYAEMHVQEEGCWLHNRLNGDVYGTQNLAVNKDAEIATPSEVVEHWGSEIDLDNMELVGKKFHASMMLFRSSLYVGCGSASKPDPDNPNNPSGMCHFHVCRYTGPGNCFLETMIDVYPFFETLLPEGCMAAHPDNYWLCSTISEHASSICQEPPHMPMHPADKCS